MSMNHEFDITVTKKINATPAEIWHALTDREAVKQWLFGTEVNSTWQQGASITYRGVWDGKPYEDKGVIQDITPEVLLKTTYFSPLSGKEDISENYNLVTYVIARNDDGTSGLSVTQENNDSQETADNMKGNWQQMLDGLAAYITSSKTMSKS